MRFMVIHSPEPLLNMEQNFPVQLAHCFGPFDSEESAFAFEEAGAAAGYEDSCYKITLPLVGPEEQDLEAAMLLGAEVGLSN